MEGSEYIHNFMYTMLKPLILMVVGLSLQDVSIFASTFSFMASGTLALILIVKNLRNNNKPKKQK